MTSTTLPTQPQARTTAAQTDLKVVLIGDQDSFRQYGSTLRSLSVGLLDEVKELTILTLGPSLQMDYIPCPPIRVITEQRGYYDTNPRLDPASRYMQIRGPRSEISDLVFPHRRIERLAETLSRIKPNLLHALTQDHAPLTRRISKYLRIPYVVTCFDMDKIHLSLSSPRCGGAFCCDSHTARQLREQYPYKAHLVRRLPLGTHVLQDPCCFQHQHRMKTICYCGPLHEGLGLAHLINAMHKLAQKGLEPNLILYGTGYYEKSLRKQVQQLKLHHLVHFVPPVEAFLEESDANKHVLRATDIFVQTGPIQQWQVEILEAMSVGAVVVTVNHPSNDLILPEKTALVVPFQDEAAMTGTLYRLLTDHGEAQAIALRAQDYLRRHYRPSQMIRHVAQGYRHACEIFSQTT